MTGKRRIVQALSISMGLLGIVVVVLLALAGYLLVLSSRLPDLRANPEGIRLAESSTVYAADGTVLAEWYDEEDRRVVPNDQIPSALRDAVVAIEDRRFYEHGGVDFQAVARALSVNTEAGEVRQGGSTITQQTVKLLYTDGKRTISRKVEEALLAVSLETRGDKDDVLNVYLNAVYFGRGAYGVESAANRFFGNTTSQLTLSQCALLAGCIQSPTRYDPLVNPGAALERRNLVLREMKDQGYITNTAAARAAAEPLGLREEREAKKPFAPYFVEYVRRDLLERLGSERLYRGGLRIYTTLEPDAQRAAEAAAKRVLPSAKDPEVAIASVRWEDGSVVAIVGGRDFSADQFDLATQGRRQTGSAFKPFVLAAALEEGYPLDSKWDATPYSTPVKDGVWRVENYENRVTGGKYTLLDATTWSINTVYARLIMAVGPEKVVDVAHRMGIRSELDEDPAIALGGLTQGVSPLEMAAAFGTIANKGAAVEPSGVERVTTDSGELVYMPRRTGSPAISKGVARQLERALHTVYEEGTGMSARTGRWAAVKTGTAQSWRDAWIVGYSGDLSTAVWVGYPKAQVAMENVHGKHVTGGSFPAEVWKRYMAQASTLEELARPVTVCAESLRIARPDCPEPIEVNLVKTEIPAEMCGVSH